MKIMRAPMEYDQDDEERVCYEANFQACRDYLRGLDSSEFDLYPDEDELTESDDLVYADI